MSIDALRDVVLSIIASADEIKQKGALDCMDFGQLLAYAEALCIIQDMCNPDVLERIGLNFDVDKRYLIGRENDAMAAPNEPLN